MTKTHATKHLPGNRVIALCWKAKPDTITTEVESSVDCKKCLKAIAFNRAEEKEWHARRAEYLKTIPADIAQDVAGEQIGEGE